MVDNTYDYLYRHQALTISLDAVGAPPARVAWPVWEPHK